MTRTKRAVATAAILLGGVLFSQSARAESLKFCIEHTGVYADNGVAGEDFYTSDTKRPAIGAQAYVYDVSASVYRFTGFLGASSNPGLGCTTTMTVPTANRSYVVYVRSYGYVNGNDVYSNDANFDQWLQVSHAFTHTQGQGTFTIKIESADFGGGYNGRAWNVFNVYNTAAFALYRHGGGMTGKLYDFYVTTGTTGHSSTTNRTSISDANALNKFVITHEMGHRMRQLKTIPNHNVDDFSDPDDCPCESASGCTTHSMRSEEYNGCAEDEGLAHFYSAITWNDDDEDDCWFEYYKKVGTDNTPKVNCQDDLGNSAFPEAYMEDQCQVSPPPTIDGNGVELDWLRTFWDLRTDNYCANPSFTSILNWMDGADDWTSTTAYDKLDEAAVARGQGDCLRDIWVESARNWNGIDH